MIDLIAKCYIEFKKFYRIENKKLPNIKSIQITDNKRQDVLAYIDIDEVHSTTTNIYYSELLSNYNEEYIKSKLFHEFTHMLDCLMFKNLFDEKDFCAFMAIYSEYHASQVELSCVLGFEDFYTTNLIDICNTYIFNGASKYTVEEDYIKPMADSLVLIDKPCDEYYSLDMVDYYLKYSRFEANLMYHIGKRDYCKIISNIIEKHYDEFTVTIEKIIKAIHSKDYKMIPILRRELWIKFLLRFPNINSKQLLKI